ncbi:MAG: (Fe-S)-binding protein, partial [Vicinamibacterales bacterium]
AETHFALREDGASLARATLRCIGVGECRKQESGTMCPSYMATLEEEHSTRGRARMLFELLQGEVLTGGWQDEHVKRSLDLCLSCKACKAECPTNVDIATYRSEFLSHYFEARRRPLHAYAFGLIDRWLRWGARTPTLTNLVIRTPGVGRLLKAAAHVAAARELPILASQPFRRLAAVRGMPTVGEHRALGPRLVEGRPRRAILWLDTFNNHLYPSALDSAARVLGRAGFECVVPGRALCCGRPLYDFGFLQEARRYLRDVLDQLGPSIQQGTPVVVLEPSCASVFRDELTNLFPDDARASQLRRQTYVLSEFLREFAPDFEPPAISRPVLLHGHCHQKALMKMDHEETLLRRTGAPLSVPDAGCCGMAGPFGFAASTYAVSQRIGERVLFPAVRSASHNALVVADGFSCREQIRQATGRPAFHLAELLDTGDARATS